MLKWPPRAKAAIRRLFLSLQPIDVFVEDEHDETFYKALLNFAANGSVTIARVFGLGGRSKVLAAARADTGERPALYLIDGDLAWVRGDSRPAIARLHRHEAYCVENLLICPMALSELVQQELVVDLPTAQTKLAFEDWKRFVGPLLRELFVAYAILNECSPVIATVSRSVAALCEKKGRRHVLCHVKVEQEIKATLSVASSMVGADEVERRRAEMLRRLEDFDVLLPISGKDYLFKLLQFHLGPLGCGITNASLRFRLSTCGDRSRFAALGDALFRAASGKEVAA